MTASSALTPSNTQASRWRWRGIAAALALQLAWGGCAPAQDNDPVVAKVNGVEIRTSDLAIAEEDIGSNLQPMAPEAKRDYLINFLSNVVLGAKAAEDKKIADGADFKRRLAYARNKLLMETMLNAEVKAALTDDAMKKVYDEAAKSMSGEKEVRARHILVATEDEAKEVLAELKKGTDFAELAKQKSKDPGAAAQGGDLGFFSKDQMVAEFAEAAFKLEPGQLSEPVKTQFGWHIIRVEEKRDRPVPPFAQVKDQIVTFLTRKTQAELIGKLREGAKIERLDKTDAPAAPAAPTAPAEPKK